MFLLTPWQKSLSPDSGIKMKTEGFDSDTIMKTISWIGRNKKKLSKKIKKFDEIHLTEKRVQVCRRCTNAEG